WAVVPAIIDQVNKGDPAAWERLGAITAPTLLIGGGPQSHIPQDKLVAVAARIPHCDLVTLPAGHLVHQARPSEIADVVLGWLSACHPSPRGAERPAPATRPPCQAARFIAAPMSSPACLSFTGRRRSQRWTTDLSWCSSPSPMLTGRRGSMWSRRASTCSSTRPRVCRGHGWCRWRRPERPGRS